MWIINNVRGKIQLLYGVLLQILREKVSQADVNLLHRVRIPDVIWHIHEHGFSRNFRHVLSSGQSDPHLLPNLHYRDLRYQFKVDFNIFDEDYPNQTQFVEISKLQEPISTIDSPI